LLPICAYVQASYRPGRYISIQWINGGQTYDAKIEQRGAYVSQNFYPDEAYVEVTTAVHAKDYLRRELLDIEGSAFGLEGLCRRLDRSIESVPVVYSNMEFVDSFTQIILDQVAKKEANRYPQHTALIVHCILNFPYLPDEWSELMERVKHALPASQFREIYLYDSVAPYSCRVFPKQRPVDDGDSAS
jgi:hypothetical protein